MKLTPATFLLSCLSLTTPFVFGKELKTSNAPFLTPEEAVAKMEVDDEFDISIYAAEPDIGEPIAFTFDGKGRIDLCLLGRPYGPGKLYLRRHAISHGD